MRLFLLVLLLIFLPVGCSQDDPAPKATPPAPKQTPITAPPVVQITAKLCVTELPGEPVTVVDSYEEAIYYHVSGTGLTGGTLTARWTIGEFKKSESLKVNPKLTGYIFKAEKPEGQWPVGKARVTLFLDDEVSGRIKFKVKPGRPRPKVVPTPDDQPSPAES